MGGWKGGCEGGRMGGRKGGREGGWEGGCEGGREGGREGERIILQKCILWCVLLMSEKEDTHPTHPHLVQHSP